MIKNFNGFLNESSFTPDLQRSVDAMILYCLKEFQPDGGNSTPYDWHKINPAVFSEDQGPDLFMNIAWSKSDPMYDDVKTVTEAFYDMGRWAKERSMDMGLGEEIRKEFYKYGLDIESMSKASWDPDETILHLYKSRFDTEESTITRDQVNKFYSKFRQKWIDELSEKLKTYLKSKKFGL